MIFVLWPTNMWYILQNILCVLEKNVHCPFLWWNVCPINIFLSSTGLLCHLRPLLPYSFLSVWPVPWYELYFKCFIIIIFLLSFPSLSFNIILHICVLLYWVHWLAWWLSGKKKSTYSVGDAGDMGLIPGLRRFLGGGNGNPLQYSWLK